MLGIVATVAGSLFGIAGLWRFSPGAHGRTGSIQSALALAAGGAGIAHWFATGDSRWMIGGILLLGGAAGGWPRGERRGVLIAALVAGLLGTALYGIALANPMQRPAVTG